MINKLTTKLMKVVKKKEIEKVKQERGNEGNFTNEAGQVVIGLVGLIHPPQDTKN